jgi:hypothetical protein
MSRSWKDVERDVRTAIVSSSQVFESRTIANAENFIAFAANRLPVPGDMGEGTWPTVRLSWEGKQLAPIEIEIHSHRYEFYRFFQGQTEIEEFDHDPSDPIPQRLAELLAEALA